MKIILLFAIFAWASHSALANEVNSPYGKVEEKRYSNNPDDFFIEYKSSEEAYADISKNKNIQNFQVGDIEGFPDIDTGVLWVFTQSHNPAHPAVMKLRAFESNKNLFMRTKVLCGASKAECDKFVSYQKYLTRSVTELYKSYKENPNKALNSPSAGTAKSAAR